LDSNALNAPTQHAIAGQAAMGLSQSTANDAMTLEPSVQVLEHVKNLARFAQKAEITRKILERYLLGTEISRIDPVYIPNPPTTYSEYTFPAQDPSVMKAEHMPTDVSSWVKPKPSSGAPPSRVMPQMYKAEVNDGLLIAMSIPKRSRTYQIKEFI
jgi:hypothetical protein